MPVRLYVKSDVLGVDSDGTPSLAIEVVVHHDMDPKTRERYEELGIHVFVFRPRWINGEPSWPEVSDIVARRCKGTVLVEYHFGAVDQTRCKGLSAAPA